MNDYDKECLEIFLKNQKQLFHEEVASTEEEAEEFLEDAMAVVCSNIKEVIDYLEEEGMDVSGMTEDEVKDVSEVFALSNGRYLIVEG